MGRWPSEHAERRWPAGHVRGILRTIGKPFPLDTAMLALVALAGLLEKWRSPAGSGCATYPRDADTAAPLRRLPSWIGITHAETSNPPPGLAAYRARLSDLPRPRADLWGQRMAPARQGRVPVRLLFAGLGSLTLAAEFLHAGPDRGEVVGSAGSVHGVSSHPLGRIFGGAPWPAELAREHGNVVNSRKQTESRFVAGVGWSGTR